MPLSARDREALALTLAGEIHPGMSRYGTDENRQEIANVLESIATRQALAKSSFHDVVHARNQYSTWNTPAARSIAQQNYSLYGADIDKAIDDYFSGVLAPTHKGITNYYSPSGMVPAGRVPDWAPQQQFLTQVGPHRFYADKRQLQSVPDAAQAEIAGLQGILQSLGMYSGEIDGKWGPLTERAVASYQQSKGMMPGEITSDLKDQIIADGARIGAIPHEMMAQAPSAPAAMAPGPQPMASAKSAIDPIAFASAQARQTAARMAPQMQMGVGPEMSLAAGRVPSQAIQAANAQAGIPGSLNLSAGAPQTRPQQVASLGSQAFGSPGLSLEANRSVPGMLNPSQRIEQAFGNVPAEAPKMSPNSRIDQAFGQIPGAATTASLSPQSSVGVNAGLRSSSPYAPSTRQTISPQSSVGVNGGMNLSAGSVPSTPLGIQSAGVQASGSPGVSASAGRPAMNGAQAFSQVAAPQQFGSLPPGLSVSPAAAARVASGLQGFTAPQNAPASALGPVPGTLGPRINAAPPQAPAGPYKANLPAQSIPTVQNPSPSIPTVQAPPAFGPPTTVQSKPVSNVPMASAIPGAMAPATGMPMNLLAQHQGIAAPYSTMDLAKLAAAGLMGGIPGLMMGLAPRAVNSMRNVMAGGMGGAANQATRIGNGLYAGVPLGGGSRIDLSNIGSKMSNAERNAMLDAGRRSREGSGLGGVSESAREATRGRSGLF